MQLGSMAFKVLQTLNSVQSTKCVLLFLTLVIKCLIFRSRHLFLKLNRFYLVK